MYLAYLVRFILLQPKSIKRRTPIYINAIFAGIWAKYQIKSLNLQHELD